MPDSPEERRARAPEEKREAIEREQRRKAEAPHALEPQEEMKAEEEQSLDAKTTYEVIRRMAEKELERAPSALFWSGLAAGLSMGLTMVVQGVLSSHIPDAPWKELLVKLGYPIGFIVVIIASQQLFTENTLTPMVSLLDKKDGRTLRKVLTLWGVVLVANIVGTALFAWFAHTEAFKPEYRDAFTELGKKAYIGTFGTTFLRALVAGWLIALMVWMLPASGELALVTIFVMAYAIGITHSSHIIAGSVETLYNVFQGVLSMGDWFGRWFVPTLLGNIVGGVGMVAAVNHAQVSSGE